MFENYRTFKQPENEDVKVWRYMDFTKLVAILESNTLHFTRSDNFDDPFEGSWPKLSVGLRNVDLIRIDSRSENISSKNRRKVDIKNNVEIERRKAIIKVSEINELSKKYSAINCWHINDHESAAMWKIYLKEQEGIAIQTTYSRLKSCLIDPETIFMGKVNYIDYETEFIASSNPLDSFMFKRKSFAHEQEIRAIVYKGSHHETNPHASEKINKHGLQIKIDIKTLIRNIYIAPNTPIWFLELVRAIIKKYDYNFNVILSKLNEDPVF